MIVRRKFWAKGKNPNGGTDFNKYRVTMYLLFWFIPIFIDWADSNATW